jgi:hypothetical protein
MHEHTATHEERRAAVRAAVVILQRARTPSAGQLVTALAEPVAWRASRLGRSKLRSANLFLFIVISLVAMYGALAAGYVMTRLASDRDEKALAIVTSADAASYPMTAMSGFSPDARGAFWQMAGSPIGVLTLAHLPPVPDGAGYELLIRHGDRWKFLGVTTPDAHGGARLVVDDPELAVAPEAIQVTLETPTGDFTVESRSVMAWPESAS